MLEHSSIYLWNTRGEGPVIITTHNYAYKKLNESAKQLQAKILSEYMHFKVIAEALLIDQPQDWSKKFKEADTLIQETIEQRNTIFETTQEALEAVKKAFGEEINSLSGLYDPAEGVAIFVPDTNALIYNPALDRWRFPETRKFTVILISTVLSELDSLKINHRNEEVRQKAERLINQIKEYRRRGSLTQGVSLVNNVSNIKTLAIEPNMKKSLPWLDPENKDDRLLASIIEIMRIHPRSSVTLVTSDINAQNKAEFAKIPFTEPPSLS